MTRPISGGEAGAVGGSYSDAKAVAAMNTWREAQPPVINPVPFPITVAAFVTFTTMTTTALVGGLYRFTLNTLTSGTNSGTLIELRVFIDTVDQFAIGPRFAFGDVTAKIPFAGDLPLALSPGVHVIELKGSHPVSPGSASVDLSVLMMERYS